MKDFCTYLFIGFLFCNILFAQESSNSLKLEQISEEKWENIVDYLNAEISMLTLKAYKDGSTLSKIEDAGLNKLSSLLDENTIEQPVPFSDLEKVLDSSWPKTLENINKPIDSIKKITPRVLDSLFIRTESILMFRKSKIGQGLEYKELKNQIIQNQYPQKTKVIDNVPEAKLPIKDVNEGVRIVEKKSFYNYWMIPSFILLISTLIFYTKWRNRNEKYEELKSSKLQFEKRSSIDIETLEKQISHLKKQIDNKKSDQVEKKLVPTPIIKNESTTFFDEEHKSPEVELVVPESAKQPKVLYAGKPTIENRFTNLSNTPISNQTIFKLTLHEGGLQADFEIDLVDTYITRSVTNAPDEHLYRVCNQENSNKDFSREIITVKKGLAFLMDGHWTVQEDNKATIKFQ